MYCVPTETIPGRPAESRSKIPWGSDEIKTQYLVLQNGLAKVPFNGPLVKVVCSQMLMEGIVDYAEVQQFFDCPYDNRTEDMRKIILMFVNRDPAVVFKFLSLLMNIKGYRIVSFNFAREIQRIVDVPSEYKQTVKTFTKNQFLLKGPVVPQNLSMSSSSVFSRDNNQVKLRKKVKRTNDTAQNRFSCPDSMKFRSLEEDSIGYKRTKALEIQKNNGQWTLINEDYVSIDVSPASDELVTKNSDHQEIDESNQENVPLVTEISTRLKKKATKRSKIKTALQVVGAAFGLGAIGWTSTSHSSSRTAITDNTPTTIANTTGHVWVNNVHSEANHDRLNVIERKVNESFYKYNFAWKKTSITKISLSIIVAWLYFSFGIFYYVP